MGTLSILPFPVAKANHLSVSKVKSQGRALLPETGDGNGMDVGEVKNWGQ